MESKEAKQARKQSKNKLIDTKNRFVVAGGEVVGRWAMWVKGLRCMVMDDN